MILNIQRLHNELGAAGIAFSGVSSDGTVSDLQPGQEALAALVLAAADKPLSSPECLAVRDALGAESPQWIAYQAARQLGAEHARIDKYQTEVLKLIVGLFETATYIPQGGGQVAAFSTVKLQEAKVKIAAIRAAFPDEP